MSFVVKYKTIPLLLALLSFLLYFWFFYYQQRAEFFTLFLVYAVLFGMFLRLVDHFKNNIKTLFYLALLFRLMCFLALPNLSQDFYRFIWDGRLIAEGVNPYLQTPNQLMVMSAQTINQADILIAGMGDLSVHNFSNYPPINQLLFLIAGWLSPNSIIGAIMIMRLIIVLADLGVFYFGSKILKHFNMPVHTIFWYVLNPFVIIELTGNLHFEGVMIFFLVLSFYWLLKQKWILAAVAIALSISVKLIPLMFLPLFLKWFYNNNENSLGLKKLIAFYAVAILIFILSFLPFLDTHLIANYSKTIGLWFQNFEFNGSIYYLARGLGYQISGYNQIAFIGKITPVLVIILVLFLSFFRKNEDFKILLASFLIALSFYFFTASTVHPWYIATLLMLGVFTGYKFPLLWSFTIMLSYSAYSNAEVQESYLLLLFEYLPVYLLFMWEVFVKRRFNSQFN